VQLIVAVVLALGAVAAALVSGLLGGSTSSSPKTSQRQSGSSTGSCSANNVNGNGNTFNCPPPKDGQEPVAPGILGERIPLNCVPPGERPAGTQAIEVTVRLWCAQRLQALLRDRRLVQTKVKLGIVNRTNRALAVDVKRWFLLTPGTKALHQWSGKPGAGWPRPRLVRFQGRQVTAIPANPAGQAELIEATPTFENFTFATHWHTSRVPGRSTFWPKTDRREPKARDGVLVFYVPLAGHKRNRSPTVLGLALMDGPRVVAFCPKGRWGKEVSAEVF